MQRMYEADTWRILSRNHGTFISGVYTGVVQGTHSLQRQCLVGRWTASEATSMDGS